MKFAGTKAFENTQAHAIRDCYGNMHTLTNNFVTSVFVKVYRRVELKVEVKLLLFYS